MPKNSAPQNSMRPFLALGLIGLAATAASAWPISFIHEGSGSGTIDGVAFSAAFTITATADTDNRESFVGGHWIDHTSATIEISNLGTFDFIQATRTFVAGNIVGFSRAGEAGRDLFNGPSDAALLGWDMTTSVGPVSGAGDLLQWDTQVHTTAGVLFFDDATTDARFTAIVVPAPAAIALFGLAAIRPSRRRR